MNSHTTVEADPRGAVSFLRALKQQAEVHPEYHPDQYESDWFTRGTEEVQERLGRPSLWSNLSPVGRGLDYEHLIGVNIGGTHPVIDDVHVSEKIVTSVKSMDTHDISYQNPDGILKKGKDYVDAFASDKFKKGVETKEGYKLPLDQIQGFHLEIAVRDNLLPIQKKALEELQKYGEKQGVRVIIVEVT